MKSILLFCFATVFFTTACKKKQSEFLPAITTSDPSSITSVSARAGGIISSDDNNIIISKGICWSTNPLPTIEDNKVADTSGKEEFSLSITGLYPNTIYYVRTYATIEMGPIYGDVKSFKTQLVTDYEGNIYNAVTIGSQVWLKENLKTSHYRNGDPITNATFKTGEDWTSLVTGAYCDNTNEIVSIVYGRLYNWYAISDERKICPEGWHVPTISEWTTLIDFLGGESVAGAKLKETGTSHWLEPNNGATNEVGFTAVAGGCRYYAGGYCQIKQDACWWSSTEYDNSFAWQVWTRNTYLNIRTVYTGKTLANSIRCIRD